MTWGLFDHSVRVAQVHSTLQKGWRNVPLVLAVLCAACLGAGCDGEKVTCGSPSSAGEAVSWSDCADGKERSVQCVAPTGQGDKIHYACTCLETGAAGKKFELDDIARLRKLGPPTPKSDIETSYNVINAQCGWALAPK